MERGYNLYEANCARCHGVNGRGRHRAGPERPGEAVRPPQRAVPPERPDGRRPVRLRQPQEPHAGLGRPERRPANYLQIQDLIAFIRAPSTQEYTRRDPELNEPVIGADGKVLTFKGWRDPDVQAGAERHARFPACWSGHAGGSAAPQPAIAAAGRRRARARSRRRHRVRQERRSRPRPTRRSRINFDNKDTGADGHNVEHPRPSGEVVVKDQPFMTGPAETHVRLRPAARPAPTRSSARSTRSRP